MPGPSPSIPLGILNPGEMFMNPYGASSPGNGANTDFNGAVSGAMGSIPAAVSGALRTFGYGTIASGLTASGTTIANATLITTQFAAFSTVASGTGAQLPPPSGIAYPVWVSNFGVSGLSVYPPNVSGIIGTASSGVAFLQATGTTTPYYFAGGNQYYHG